MSASAPAVVVFGSAFSIVAAAVFFVREFFGKLSGNIAVAAEKSSEIVEPVSWADGESGIDSDGIPYYMDMSLPEDASKACISYDGVPYYGAADSSCDDLWA